MTAWQAAELFQFIDASANERFAAMWHLAATTGMRRGELLGLQWSDINLEAKTLKISRARVRAGNETITDTPKTEAGKRTIHLDDRTINSLKQHKARQAQEKLSMGGQWSDTDGHVFTEADGSLPNPNTITRRFLALCKKSRLRRIRLHDVRHSYVVASRAAGVDIKTVSQRIGHADTNVTLSVYAHVFTTDDQAAANDTASFIYGQKNR
jgi:integrase